jgi:hypothetical protein
MRRVLGVLVVAAVIGLLWKELPAIRRYIKIETV